MWPSHGLIILSITRLTNETLPLINRLVLRVSILATNLNRRRPEDPSLANGTTIPVSQLGSYKCICCDYLGPVKPGFSNQTSTS